MISIILILWKQLIHEYVKFLDPTTLLPTLWIGTTLGSVLTMMISLPEAELRHTQPVVVSTSGETSTVSSHTSSDSCIVSVYRPS